ncbi:MAG: hypothetical protein ACRC3Y_11395 [Romboutsia sp.]|uniref:hypothetical protein n=1 Tax=Romboutsia sp. TaxID=1965302 RepID=UPI003F3883D7
MENLIKLLEKYNDEGINFMSVCIKEYCSTYEYSYYVIPDEFNMDRYEDIKNIIRVDKQDESITIFDNIFEVLESILNNFKNYDARDFSVTEQIRFKSIIYFLELILRNNGYID